MQSGGSHSGAQVHCSLWLHTYRKHSDAHSFTWSWLPARILYLFSRGTAKHLPVSLIIPSSCKRNNNQHLILRVYPTETYPIAIAFRRAVGCVVDGVQTHTLVLITYLEEICSEMNIYKYYLVIYFTDWARSYLPLTTLGSCVHLTKILSPVGVESGFAGVEWDRAAIERAGLALVAEKLPAHYIPKADQMCWFLNSLDYSSIIKQNKKCGREESIFIE